LVEGFEAAIAAALHDGAFHHRKHQRRELLGVHLRAKRRSRVTNESFYGQLPSRVVDRDLVVDGMELRIHLKPEPA